MAEHRIQDPEYGEMIKIDELSVLTGIPKATIRLWRRPEYQHLAKFDDVEYPNSNARWYALQDVQEWLISNGLDPEGNVTQGRRNTRPNAFRSNKPVERIDPKRHDAITHAKKINRNNHKEIMAKLIKPFDNPGMVKIDFATKHIEALTNAWFKDEEPVAFTNFFPAKQLNGMFPSFRDDPIPEERERAHFILANLTRLLDAELNGRELSVEDAVAIPL
jgi:hypothetical protein